LKRSINRNYVPHRRLFLRPKKGGHARRADGNVQIPVLEAIADGQPIEIIASLICRTIERLMPGAAAAVLRADGDCGVVAVAGASCMAEHIEALAQCSPIAAWDAADAPFPLELACCPPEQRAGWARLCKVSASAHVVLLAFLPAMRPLRPREHRLFETCIHLLQVAFAQVAVRRRLETTNHRLGVALNSISQGVCFFDGAGRLLLANPRYAEIYGLDPERIQPGMSLPEIVTLRLEAGAEPVMTSERYVEWRERIQLDGDPTRSVVQLANGRVIEIHHQPMPDRGWVATHEDITARQGAEARVAHMARHDALTSLANRRLFRDRLDEVLGGAGPAGVHAVLCLDLDGFKPVNDSFGHSVGDCLLQAVAGRLSNCARKDDTVARLGGDEFAILAVGLDRPARAGELAQRITRALNEPFQIGDALVSVGVSVGIALSPADGITPEDLLKKSDIALYRAKADERGSHRFFEPTMQDRLIDRMRLENELRTALARNEFEVFYQPLLDLESGHVCAFEALLRWRHPDRGLVAPGEFIPVAEESGLIVPLGAWVLMQACAEAAGWPEQITVSVNLSAAQFKSKSLVGAVEHALAASGLAASRLELEVTESLLLENDASTLCTLQTLSGLGARISMDDFGTGHSSLNYLRRFPFNKLKIDRSYIRDMSNRPDSLAIVRAILGLGRSLNMVTTAEGVETEAQLARLQEEGCDEVQGYLFSEPRPAAEVPHMLLSGMRQARGAPPAAPVSVAA
jgi:diguanylate cyclase (GGDEF)-like protein/PAS domain S-box-containing protein